MRRLVGAFVAVIAIALVMDLFKVLNFADAIHRNPTLRARVDEEGPSQRRPEAYCLNCKLKRQINNPQILIMNNGRAGIRGSCPVCGKGIFSAANKAT